MISKITKALLGAIAFSCVVSVQAAPPLNVTADSAIIIDAQSGKVLWGKDQETPRYPASTTKIMTAMLLIEHCTPDEVITAPAECEKVEGASLHLKAGEQITAGEMLYGLLLRSANDACVAVADHISGSVPAFVQLMNQRAKQIGCKNTHFDNPNGLNDDAHTISAYDLALIAREAMKYPAFRDVVSIRRHELKRSINTQDRFLVSKNKYLSMDPTADGIKTGWTRDAGQCYVGSATRNGYRVITVILHSTDWKADNASMLNWAFANFDRTLVVKAGDAISKLDVSGAAMPEIDATVSDDVYQVFDKEHPVKAVVSAQINAHLEAPIQQGQQVGIVTFSDADGWIEKVPLIASRSVQKSSMMGMGHLSFFCLCGVVGSGAYILLKRRVRRYTRYGRKLRHRQA